MTSLAVVGPNQIPVAFSSRATNVGSGWYPRFLVNLKHDSVVALEKALEMGKSKKVNKGATNQLEHIVGLSISK